MQRHGSVLIVVVTLVAFLVLLGGTFLSTMAAFRGAGASARTRLLVEMAAQSGETHVKHVLQQHASTAYAGGSTTIANRGNDWFSNRNSSWRRVFEADVDMEPGGSWPSGAVPRYNLPERQRSADVETFGGLPFTASEGMFETMGWYMGSGASRTFESAKAVDSIGGSRYFETAYLDRDLQPVSSGDEDRARYVLRYAALVIDLDGMLNMNFYPEHLYPEGVIEADAALRERLAALRQRYTMHLHSMMAVDGFEGKPGVADDNAPMFTSWIVGVDNSDGRRHYVRPFELALRYHCWPFTMQEEHWHSNMNEDPWFLRFQGHRLGALFEGRGRIMGFGGYQQVAPGPVYSWGRIATIGQYRTNFKMGPHALGWQLYGAGLSRRLGDDTDAPWRVNILTAPRTPVRQMLYGICAQTRLGYGSGSRNYSARAHQSVDLLPFAQGRPVLPVVRNPVQGVDDNYHSSHDSGIWQAYAHNITDASLLDNPGTLDAWHERLGQMRQWFYGFRNNEGSGIGPRLGEDHAVQTYWINQQDHSGNTHNYTWVSGATARNFGNSNDRARGAIYHDSYEFDVIDALALATEAAAFAWNGARGLGNGVGPDPIYRGTAANDQSFDLLSDLRQDFVGIHDVERFFLRILGERVRFGDRHDPSTWRADARVLANVPVPYESDYGRDGWFIPDNTYGNYIRSSERSLQAEGGTDPNDELTDWLSERNGYAVLRADADSAGMERFLNDVRMSFFGSPALDFNYDGWAESSVNGFDDGSGGIEASGTPLGGGMDAGDQYAPAVTTGPDTPPAVVSGDTRAWRAGAVDWFPIGRPFSATGRLHLGKSRVYRCLVRGQLWDRARQVKVGETTVDFAYVPNPSDDLDTPHLVEGRTVDDAHVLYRRSLPNTQVSIHRE